MRHNNFKIKPSDEPLIKMLMPKHQSIMLLSSNPTASLEDMAASLNVPLGTVKSRQHRARNALVKLREASAV